MNAETPKQTAADKRKERALKVKEANRIRLEKLAAMKADRKKAREDAKAKKASKPAPDPVKEAAKKAKAEAAKAAKEAKEKATAEATKTLAPIAKEINTRLEKAAKMEKDADDHRLAAALRLKDAEEQCKAAGLHFKKWSEEHVKGQSFETVRKLLAVGKADEPMLALQDMRAANAAANRKLREKQKAERQQPRSSAEGDESEGGSDDEPTLEGLDGIKEAFAELKASEQMEFAEWAAKEVGAKLDMGM